jgi:SAM-dependent methyltransferase
MFMETAELYDAIYGSFKNYAAEALAIAAIVRVWQPRATTILDVGCGTGEHAKHLWSAHGFSVEGLDIDPALLAIARAKLPALEFFTGDMAAFALGRQFDVVLCLFSAIGYLKIPERITAALTCFRQHLKPGGLVLVEPWFEPAAFHAGAGPEVQATLGELRVKRSSNARVEDRISSLHFTYRVERWGQTRVIEEVHELGLLTKEEMLDCFGRAGLVATHAQPGLSGRGLYLAKPR